MFGLTREEIISGIKQIIADEQGYASTEDVCNRLKELIK